MAQAIKYSASYVNNTIKKGNLSLGTESVGYGPSSSTGFYNTVNPPLGGYVTYNNNNGTLSYNIANNDSELISYLSGRRGQTMTTIAEAISWAATQSDIMVTNSFYYNIPTSGLCLNYDAKFIPSAPLTGTSWYNLGSTGGTQTLFNGLNIQSAPYITLDGVDDSTYYDSGFPGGLGTTNDFSLSFTMMFLNNFTGGYNWLSSYGDTSGMFLYRNDFWDAGRAIWLGYVNADQGYYGLDGYYSLNTWYTFTITCNSSGLFTGYVNGSQVTSQQMTNFVRWYSKQQGIGVLAYNPGCNYSNIRLYNRGLSATEVKQLYYQAPIVTSGLTYSVDMSNVMSYSGAGTSINTFVPSSTAGVMTMYNGIGFNNSYGGYLSLDGVDDYASCSDGANRFGTPSSGNSMTFVITFKTYETTQVNGSDFLLGGCAYGHCYSFELFRTTSMSVANRRFNLPAYSSGSGSVDNGLDIIFPVSTTDWNIVQLSLSSSGGYILTLNGNVVQNASRICDNSGCYFGSLTASATTIPNFGTWIYGRPDLLIGTGDYGTDQSYIANYYFYNRNLSLSEMQTNFQALRGRFGL